MKSSLAAIGLLFAAQIAYAPAAQAQVTVGPAGVTIGAPSGGDYWRQQQAGQNSAEWRRREEYKEEAKHAEWQHGHCVKDWHNQEYCRK